MFKHRSFIPVIAFMTCVTLFSFVMPLFDFIYASDFSLINSTLALVVVVYPLVEAAIRFFLTSKAFDPGKHFFSVPIKESYLRQGLYYSALILVILAVPFVRGQISMNLAQLAASLLVWHGAGAVMLLLTQKKTMVSFMNDAIIVKGLDLRMEFPLNDPIRTNSGIYGYKGFSGFYIEGQTLGIFLKDRQGHLKMELPADKIQHIIAFLLSKEIKRVQIHELPDYK